MDFTQYIAYIEKKLKRYFDIEQNFVYKDTKIDLFAKYFQRNEKYILTKKATIYGIESNEYCFIKYYPHFDRQDLEQFQELLIAAVDDFVHPHEEHMSSIITGVMVTDQTCEEELLKMIKKFKYHKGFAFGFKGWVDIRLLLVIPDKGEVVANKKGKEVQKVYQIV